MNHLATFLRHYLLAVQFFTRIPVTGRLARWVGFDAAMLQRSLAHLPGIGALVGAAAALVFAALLWLLPAVAAAPWVAAIFGTAAGVLLTGAFHEDGLADLADGLGGSYDRERALDIMKDSRIGSFGSIALVLALLAKVALLALLAQADARAAVLAVWLAHVWSRAMPLWITFRLPHVGDTLRSKSKPIAAHIRPAALGIGACWCLLALALAYALAPAAHWWAAVPGALLGGALVMRKLHKRLQGFTGDGLGAAQQLGEIGCLLALAIGLQGAP